LSPYIFILLLGIILTAGTKARVCKTVWDRGWSSI